MCDPIKVNPIVKCHLIQGHVSIAHLSSKKYPPPPPESLVDIT